MKIVNDIVRLNNAIAKLQTEVDNAHFKSVKLVKRNTLNSLKARNTRLKRSLSIEERNLLHFAETFSIAV